MKSQKYIITSLTKASSISPKALEAMKTYAKIQKAQVLILTTDEEIQDQTLQGLESDLVKVCSQSFAFNKTLRFVSKKVSTKNSLGREVSNPFKTVSSEKDKTSILCVGEDIIYKLSPLKKLGEVKLLCSVGCVPSGKEGYGLVLEVSEKFFQTRILNFQKDGSFLDEGVEYSSMGAVPKSMGPVFLTP